MSNIPGLSLVTVENGDENAIEIPSFIDNVAIPESHKHGNCRRITDFMRVSKIAKGKFYDMYLCRDLKTEERDSLLKNFKMPPDSENDSGHDMKTKEKHYRHLKKFIISPGFENGVPKEILREFNILNTLNHVNIIKSHGPVTGSSLEINYLILDFCRFSLKDVIKKNFPIYEESVVKCIVQQLFLGLQYIHSALILHRDISSENIVFNSEGILKITGFQCSRFDNGDVRTPVQSEKRYQAPELLLYSNTKTYDSKVDMWSAGCVLAEFGLRKPLFTGVTDIEVLDSIFKVLGTPDDSVWPGFDELFALVYDGKRVIIEPMPYCDLKAYITGASTSCFNIINNLLVYSAKSRFNAKDCLELNYFKENPTACSTENLAAILKASAKTPVTPTT